MARLSTHVLDTYSGRPATGMSLTLDRKLDSSSGSLDGDWERLLTLVTNADGRTDQPLLQGETIQVGIYRLTFDVQAYFQSIGANLAEPAFLMRVPLVFGVADPKGHYHVPLLCTPWSYSTYRGS
ncbi:MAG: hydroxyisourate hydrolase [Bordetella sp.]